MDRILAAIDCGTNSTRLLIAKQTGPQEYEALHREAQITRLGEGTDRSQELGTEAMDRVLATLIDYVGKINDQTFKVGEITSKILNLYMKEVDPDFHESS